MLECNLIKEHRPRYNTMLKDDKTYPYIKVTASEEYPRILFSMSDEKRIKNKYFGPFYERGGSQRHNRADSEDIPDPGVQPEAAAGYGERTVRASITIFTSATRHVRGYISQADYQKSVKQAVWFFKWTV